LKEVNEDLVAQFLAQINYATLPDIPGISDKIDEDLKRIIPIILDLFINKRKFKNPLHFLEDIFRSEDESKRDLLYFKRNIPEANKVIDVGCGWGIFTKLLCEEYEAIFAVDWVLEHAIATKVLSPKARVYHGDARDMHLLKSGYFDVVFARNLIEHVGDPVEPTGKSVNNFYHQYNLVKEISYITKPNGTIFLTTGNYNFPRDGEDNLWFYHWLPTKEKMDYCAQKNISTDNYWLLNWPEIDFLLSVNAFSIESVTPIDTKIWDNSFIGHLDKAFQGLDCHMTDLWKNLIKKDPNFFSSWHIIARKTGIESAILNRKNNRCYYHRTLYFNESCDNYCQIVAALEAEIQKIQRTLSWRLTKPLRWLRRALKR